MLALHMKQAVGRRLSRWLARRPITVRPSVPVVSFTFDDFPRSALLNGGRILERYGAAGTFYASLGLAGRSTATGPAFERGDIEPLLELGHELGCHTYSHCPAWETETAAYEASVRRNADALRELIPDAAFGAHSYPISHPRPDTKRIASRYFHSCRAGGQTYNTGVSDLNHLNAFFIEQARGDFEVIKRVIVANERERGWLIFATHDVTAEPTRFGCTPEFFERTVRAAVVSGARLLPVTRALATVAVRAPARSPAAAGHSLA